MNQEEHTTGRGRNLQALVRSLPVRFVLSEKRTPYHYLRQLSSLDPGSLRLLVVKIGYLVPELASLASRAYLALTPGAVDQRIETLAYGKIRMPMYPLDRDVEFPTGPVTGRC